MKKIELNLSDTEYESLKYRLKYDKNWRIRERIESLLLLSSGLSCEKVGLKQGLSRKTIESTRSGWLKEKFDSLADKPRSGAPSKISEKEVEVLLKLVDEKPMCSKEVLAAHIENGGVLVNLETIRRMLKSHEKVWKRTRGSLQKKETL